MDNQGKDSPLLTETDAHVPPGRPVIHQKQSFIVDERIWTIAGVCWETGTNGIGIFTLCECGKTMRESVCILGLPFQIWCWKCHPAKRLEIPKAIAEKASKFQRILHDVAWEARASSSLGPRGRIPI